uniref:Sushi domain-containing protein n=1 Tax=Zonotrichia albicollis TaxID=44394 RepID=A0A8D2NB26_ZONAL
NWILLEISLVGKYIDLFTDIPCDLPQIENGNLPQYYYSFKSYYFPMDKGKKLSYSCVVGYTTESGTQDGRITCTAKGWSPVPRCYSELALFIIASSRGISWLVFLGFNCLSLCPISEMQQDCASPPVVKNGAVLGPVLASYKNGSWVEYVCQYYHILDGPSTVYCHQGNWTEQPTCLEPCTLNVTDMDSNNLTLKWRREELVFLHGDLIEFECKQGFSFLQTAIPSPGRTQCDQGRLNYPKCYGLEERP